VSEDGGHIALLGQLPGEAELGVEVRMYGDCITVFFGVQHSSSCSSSAAACLVAFEAVAAAWKAGLVVKCNVTPCRVGSRFGVPCVAVAQLHCAVNVGQLLLGRPS
jgi:hypothetical protein